MEKITSFKIDHTKMNPGIYISRVDPLGDSFYTTFDLRFVKPNSDDIMDTDGIHAFEHIAATFLRNYYKGTMYFGPMGCRTGFYWIVQGDKSVSDVIHTIIMLLSYVINSTFIPGATEVECGNYRDMDLAKAIKYAENYLKVVLSIE